MKLNFLKKIREIKLIFFFKGLNSDVLGQAHDEIEECDVCLVVGTSSVVYPAAMFAPMVCISVFNFDNYYLFTIESSFLKFSS